MHPSIHAYIQFQCQFFHLITVLSAEGGHVQVQRPLRLCHLVLHRRESRHYDPAVSSALWSKSVKKNPSPAPTFPLIGSIFHKCR
jgi:hypothetical protein